MTLRWYRMDREQKRAARRPSEPLMLVRTLKALPDGRLKAVPAGRVRLPDDAA